MQDHDGKSKASGVMTPDPPAFDEIAQRAYELWIEKGCPHGSAEQDWHEAEQQLMLGHRGRTPIPTLHDKTGSVQR